VLHHRTRDTLEPAQPSVTEPPADPSLGHPRPEPALPYPRQTGPALAERIDLPEFSRT
jgi:hypothetical protein